MGVNFAAGLVCYHHSNHSLEHPMTLLSLLILLAISSHVVRVDSSSENCYYLTMNNNQNVVSQVKTTNPRKYFKTLKYMNNIVRALYQPAYNETGWDILEISTNKTFSDEDQAYAAGYLEGAVTHDAIYNHYFNSMADFCYGRETLCAELDDFIEENLIWVQDNIDKHGDAMDYWHQVKLYYKQMEGLVDGYMSVNKEESTALGYKEIMWLNNPDLGDIVEMLKARKSNFSQADFEEMPKVLGLLRCSALIKILPDGSEMFAAQDTWSEYASMTRMLKKYDLGFHKTPTSDELIPGRTMTFSSYPGVITSGDDFYLISSGLVTMETTIGNSNASLWKNINATGQVSEGARSAVAHRLAENGRSWSEIFAKYNSGTYNNQWMVLDYKKFKRGTLPENLPNDLLWVVEQIPGFTHARDVTSVLRTQGYWPSYNVAYFKDIFNKSGNEALVMKYGDWFTYEKNPRALIFRRDHGTVHDLESMLALMRYNNYKNDELSKCDCVPPYSAENAIAARCDLNPVNGTFPFPALGHRSHGATDAKITSSALFSSGLRFLSVSGPPHNISRGIPPFQWSKTDFGDKTRHVGQPDLWDFKPLTYKWT